MLKHNKQITISLIASSLILSTAGCSWFSANDGREDIDDDYLRSQQGTELQIPADMKELSMKDKFPVPEGAVIVNREPKGKALPLEPPQLLLIGGDGVREDADAPHPTVWVRAQSEELMSYLKQFAASKNIVIDSSSGKEVTTGWLGEDDDNAVADSLGSYNIDGQRHQFQLSIIAESGLEVGLQSLHSKSEQDIDGKWVPIETSDRVAKQFLNQFISFYDAKRTQEAREKILAEGSIDTRLGLDNSSNMAIVTERDFQAVWTQLASVLEYLNLAINDRDQSAGTYYITVPEDGGFWDAVFGKGAEDDAKVELVAGDYQVQVVELTDGGTGMVFKDDKGKLLEANLVSKIYPEFAAAFRSKAIRN